MVIGLAQPTQDDEDLQLEINISTTLGVTAMQAKRTVTRFFVDNVSMFLTPQTPLLVVIDPQTIRWRFPIIFSLGRQGKLGQVGEVDVDAFSGELQLTDASLREIKRNAERLAQSAALSAVS